MEPKSIDQDKTLFERVDDAVERRKDQKKGHPKEFYDHFEHTAT